MPPPRALIRYPQGVPLSTKAYRRVVWVVVDGLGFEHCRRSLDGAGAEALSALAAIAREGILGPIAPSSPVCQTPPALLSLFCGTSPAENGVWGYRQPDYAGNVRRSVSGFSVTPRGAPPVWHDVDAAGGGVTLLNVAFRRDRVWAGGLARVDLAFDGFRLAARPVQERLGRAVSLIHVCGLELSARPRGRGVEIRKGSRTLGILSEGEGRSIRLTRGTSAFFQLLPGRILYACPYTPAGIRCSHPGFAEEISARGLDRFADMNVFRTARRLSEKREPSPDAEMLTAEASFAAMADLLCLSVERLPSRLFVGYFPLIDYLNHASMDLLEDEPQGRASRVMMRCMGLVDSLVNRLMKAADPDTLLVLSSDHGAAPYRRMFYLNEALAEAGLVRRGKGGYLLSESPVYYHHADCGQVIFNGRAARGRGLSRAGASAAVHRVLQNAASAHGVKIGTLEPSPGDPYLLFLHPEGDAYFTGRAPGRPGLLLSRSRRGGEHLSPHIPTPWINAVLGMWSPRPGFRGSLSAPQANSGMKRLILDCLGIG